MPIQPGSGVYGIYGKYPIRVIVYIPILANELVNQSISTWVAFMVPNEIKDVSYPAFDSIYNL